MPDFRLTRRAERDLVEIFLFGFERFGEAQAERYRASFERCFRLLAENPGLGRSAHGIAPGLRRHEHESHVVLYEERHDGIMILALVHGYSIRRLDLR